MLSSEANVATDRPSRYLVQLCQHVERFAKAEWSETEGSIDLGWARCTLRAGQAKLTLHAEAADETSLRRLQDLIGGRVAQIGRRDHLTVQWNTDRSGGAPRWVKVFGVVAIVLVVLVVVMLLSGHNPGRHGGQSRPTGTVGVSA